ncbi:MAG: autotransporter-associated beta strand repeat-containing protein [Kiritimatiellales bacterium]|nr:autotransporter-associated beta strand repeat-containing protein [Kiritimatiellales bacterium]
MKKIVMAVAIAMGLSLAAQAASDSWNVDADGSYTNTANWLGGVVPGVANGTTTSDEAAFSYALTSNCTVTLPSIYAIGTITFGNTSTNGYLLTGSTFRINNGGVIQTLAGTGNHNDTIASTINLRGLGNSVITIRNDSVGNTAGLVISGAINSTVPAGKTFTLVLDGVSTAAGIGGTTRNNTISGVVGDDADGTVAVVKNGTGLWTLTGNNAFEGGLTVNAGTIRYFGAGNTCFGRGTVTINDGVTFSKANSSVVVVTNQMVVNGDFTFANNNTGNDWAGAMDFAGGDRKITANANLTISGAITNAERLTKAGSAILTLSGANTFTQLLVSAGTVIAAGDGVLGTGRVSLINSGSLVLTNGVLNDYIADTADLAMATNSTVTLALDFSGTDTVHSISLDSGATTLPAGTYGAADLTGLGTATYTGTGFLTATSGGSGYDTWAGSWGLSLGAPTDDYDNDGLLNIYEYGLGGDPTNGNSQGNAPVFGTQTLGGTNYFGYIYPQLKDTNSGISYTLALTSDLVNGPWTTNSGYIVYGTNVMGSGDFDYVTNVTTTVAGQKFIRLIIE